MPCSLGNSLTISDNKSDLHSSAARDACLLSTPSCSHKLIVIWEIRLLLSSKVPNCFSNRMPAKLLALSSSEIFLSLSQKNFASSNRGLITLSSQVLQSALVRISLKWVVGVTTFSMGLQVLKQCRNHLSQDQNMPVEMLELQKHQFAKDVQFAHNVWHFCELNAVLNKRQKLCLKI